MKIIKQKISQKKASNKKRKVAIVGSRNISDTQTKKIEEYLDSIKDSISLVISGGAKGVDTIAKDFADTNSIPIVVIKPKYHLFSDNEKKRAPLERNKEISDQCDTLYAFWDGVSTGTKNIIDYSLENKDKKDVIVVNI